MAWFSKSALSNWLYSGSVTTISSSFNSPLFNTSVYGQTTGTFVASGSSQATAMPLTTGSYHYICSGTGSTKGIILQSGHATLGQEIKITNNASSSVFLLYPPVSGTLSSGSANDPQIIAMGNTYTIICYQTGSTPRWSISGK